MVNETDRKVKQTDSLVGWPLVLLIGLDELHYTGNRLHLNQLASFVIGNMCFFSPILHNPMLWCSANLLLLGGLCCWMFPRPRPFPFSWPSERKERGEKRKGFGTLECLYARPVLLNSQQL